MSSPLLHIGYHKTGTTWLQRSVFPNPAAGFALVGGVKDLLPMVVMPGPFHFDAGRVRSKLAPGVEAARRQDLVPVLSYERLSGNPHEGGRDSSMLADRLHETFPEAKVLIVIREQRSMILSLYKTYVRTGGPATLEQYLRVWANPNLPPLFDSAHLEYHPLIGYYRDLFGPENVLALPYELLQRWPWRFAQRIAKFSGAELREYPKIYPVNVSYSALGLAAKRVVNKWCVEGRRNPTPVSPVRISDSTLRSFFSRLDRKAPEQWRKSRDRRWKCFVEETVGDSYAKSNAVTAALTGLDLGEFGYPL